MSQVVPPAPLLTDAQPAPGPMSFWGVLRRPFVLDLRALALLRIATAAVVLPIGRLL